MNTLNMTPIKAAVAPAFQSALATFTAHAADAAQPALQRVAAQQIGEGCTLRTDVYAGPHGSGFAVVAMIKIGSRIITRVRQHSPETWRERDWDHKAIQSALDEDYNAQVTEGITVNGITLAAQKDDCDKFTQLIALLREAEELQPDDAAKMEFRASTVSIADIHNTVHQLTVTQARQFIVQYGHARNALWTDFANRRALLK